MNSIDWTARHPRPSGYRVQPDHPLLPVFDTLTVIKAQLDKTTRERNSFLEELLRQQENLEEEVRLRTEKIREGERRFQQILEHSPISLALMDFAFQIEFINKKATETFGYEREELRKTERICRLIAKVEKNKNLPLREELRKMMLPRELPRTTVLSKW